MGSMPNAYNESMGPMRMEGFCRIIDQLQELEDPVRVIRFYKEAEPFLS